MGFFANLKARLSPAAYFGSSITKLDGYGTNGAKRQPFNIEAAQRQFKGWAFAAVMFNADAAAGVPLRLYARNRPSLRRAYEVRSVSPQTLDYLHRSHSAGRDFASSAVRRKVVEFADELVEVVEPHPALAVLDRVNEFANGYEFSVRRFVDLQVAGNSYIHPIIGPMGVPFQAWRMPPQWVQIIPDTDRFIAGYQYGRKPDDRTFAVDEVIHFKAAAAKDLFYAMGWFEAAWDAICLHASKRLHDQAKFDNMARPDWLLTTTGNFKKEAIDDLERKMNEKHRGPANAGKFAVVGAELKAQNLQFDVPEVGTPTRVIEEIAAASHVPVAMLLSNDPSKASSQTARVLWYRNGVKPLCRLDEEKLNEKWLPLFDGAEDMFLAYDEVTFEDQDALSKRLVMQVAGGVSTPNEARTELGLRRHDDGDTLYFPGGTTGVAGDEPEETDEVTTDERIERNPDAA